MTAQARPTAPATADGGPGLAVADVLAEHAATLAAAGVPSPEVDALLLAEHVLGIGRREVRTATVTDPDALARLAALVARRAASEPVQRLTGRTWFRTIELLCEPGVFIPRPETEVVAGHAIGAARAVGRDRPVVVEPCTGTGAIALAIAAEVRGAEVVASDLDAAAVACASTNLARVRGGQAGVPGLATGATCSVEEGDLLAAIPAHRRGHVDVLVANPPYLPDSDRADLPADVLAADPGTALFGGPDGLATIDRLIAAAPEWLSADGWLVVEVDPRHAATAAARAREAGFATVSVEPDLTGTDRVLVASGRVAGS